MANNEYTSTAQALAQPFSPPRSPHLSISPSPVDQGRPSFGRRRSAQSPNAVRHSFAFGHGSGNSNGGSNKGQRGRGLFGMHLPGSITLPTTFSSHDNNEDGGGGGGGGYERQSWLSSTLTQIESSNRRLNALVSRMTPLQIAATVVAGIAIITLAILFLVFSEKIFEWLEPVAEKWKNLRGGWMILWLMTFATAFPPIIGYSTCLTLAGFVFGVGGGWPIVASATVVGSTCSFILCRTCLTGFVERLVSHDRRFEALNLVLKYDGLKLLVMIRLCPLPYSLSNGAISTFRTVKVGAFALATVAATPKLFIAVFVGSRLAVIAKSGEKMDAATKAVNWASVIFGVLLGLGTGWLIYTRTLARSRQLEAEERGGTNSGANGAASRRTTAQPPADFSDDVSDDQTAVAELIRDDQIDFLDHEERGTAPAAATKPYRDDLAKDEGVDDDVFRFGDSYTDEDQGIGMGETRSKT